MTVAIDTNVLVRLLVRDNEAQYAAAQRLVDRAAAADEPVLIVLGVLLETEWVLRSRYKLDKASIAAAYRRGALRLGAAPEGGLRRLPAHRARRPPRP